MTRQQAFRRLAGLGLIFVLLSGLTSLWLPLHKTADEMAHFRYARFIANHGRLPLSEIERAEADYKSNQPPLYHALVAGLTFWVDDSPPPRLKFVEYSGRPELAELLLDTKRLANTIDELWPYRGPVLLWHAGRWVTIALGVAVIGLAYLTALEFFGRRRPAIYGATLIAVVPTFVLYSAAMSYEPLVALAVGLMLWLLIKLFKGRADTAIFAALGATLGLALTVKYATVIFPLEVVLLLSYLARRNRWGWRRWLGRLALVAGVAAAVSVWWAAFLMTYFNQVETHGPVLGLLQPLLAGTGDTTQNYLAYRLTGGEIGRVQTFEFESASLSDWLRQTFQTFWLEPVEGVSPLGGWPYWFAAGVCLVAIAGLVRRWRTQPGQRLWLVLLLTHGAMVLALPLVRFLVQGHLNQTAQGRHLLFPLATALPLLLIYGWQALFPPRVVRRLVLSATAGLLIWSVAHLLWLNVGAASLYLPVRTTDITGAIQHRLDWQFEAGPHLLGYSAAPDLSNPALDVTLYWQAPAYPDEDFLTELQLYSDGDDEPALTWEAYPTNARYPSRIWEPGETILDRYHLPLAAVPPGNYTLRLTLHTAQGPQLPLGQTDGRLNEILLPPPDEIEPAFDAELTLDGRQFSAWLWPVTGDPLPPESEFLPRMEIPLLWQGTLRPDERLDWLLVGPEGQVFPMTPVTGRFASVQVRPDWPGGTYRLRAELWSGDAVIASGETGSLLNVKNERPRRMEVPEMPHRLAANFDGKLLLLGYRLPRRNLSPGQAVPITLYWQGVRTMGHSYTVFTKLFDDDGRQWAGVERLPADGYKTTFWLAGEVVEDSFALPLPEDIPAGVYRLNVGLYRDVDGAAVSLPLLINGRPGDATSLTFGPINIGGPPPGVVEERIDPQRPASVMFGEAIALRGYDEPLVTPDAMQLGLYWQSLAQTGRDYTVFAHIRDEANQTVAQMDRPPTNNRYPTAVWSPGEYIPDRMTVPLPPDLPAGRYRVVIGLYQFDTGQRLLTADQADSITLAEFTIP